MSKAENFWQILAQVIIWAFIAVYVISPVDFFPGPLDDIVVTVVGYYVQSKLPINQ